MAETQKPFNLTAHHRERLAGLAKKSPYVVRFAEWKKYPAPVLVVKERREAAEEKNKDDKQLKLIPDGQANYKLCDVAHASGDALRRCSGIFKQIVSEVRGPDDIPLELQRYFTKEGFALRVNLPLDENAGAKLGLIFKLQMRVKEMDRVELIARRVARFTREEAAYWLSRLTTYNADANKWAQAGMRIMLGGTPGDKGIEGMLSRMREQL